MEYNDYLITKFIYKNDKMKALEKLCVICNEYYPHVIKGLCKQHYNHLKTKRLTIKDKVKTKRYEEYIKNNPQFLSFSKIKCAKIK